MKIEQLCDALSMIALSIFIFSQEAGNANIGHLAILLALIILLFRIRYVKISVNRTKNAKEIIALILLLLILTVQLIFYFCIYKEKELLTYGFYDLYNLFIPPLFCFLLFINSNKKNKSFIAYNILLSTIIATLIFNKDFFHFEYLKDLSLLDSSSAQESNLALRYLYLFIYFIFNKKYMSAFVSALLCLLCFKRTEMMFVFIFLFLFLYFQIRKKAKYEFKHKKLIFGFSFILFLAVPIVIMNVLNSDFEIWFNSRFEYTLTEFTSGRNLIYRAIFSDSFIGKGIGSADYVLSLNEYYSQIRFTHGDLLKVYNETGLVIYSLFLAFFLYLGRNNKISFSVILVLLVSMTTTHRMTDFLGNFLLFFLIETFDVEYLKQKQNKETIVLVNRCFSWK